MIKTVELRRWPLRGIFIIYSRGPTLWDSTFWKKHFAPFSKSAINILLHSTFLALLTSLKLQSFSKWKMSVCLSVCPSVCLSVNNLEKGLLLQKYPRYFFQIWYTGTSRCVFSDSLKFLGYLIFPIFHEFFKYFHIF